MEKKINKILCIRSDRFGEFLLTLPAIMVLRDSLPEVQIDLLATASNNEIVRDLGYVDNVIEYEDKLYSGRIGTLRLAYLIRKNAYDAVVCFNPKKNFHVASFLGGAKYRLGYKRKLGFLLNCTLPGVEFYKGLHEADKNVELIKLLGVNKVVKNFMLPVDQTFENKWGLKGKYIFIHPFSSDGRKEVDLEFWIELIKKVQQNYKIPIALIGAEQDYELAKIIVSKIDLLNFVGKFDLRELTFVYKNFCSLHIGLDSGPAHLAGILNIPVLSIFNLADPRRWKPLGDNAVVVNKENIESLAEDLETYLENIKLLEK